MTARSEGRTALRPTLGHQKAILTTERDAETGRTRKRRKTNEGRRSVVMILVIRRSMVDSLLTPVTT